MPQRHMLCFAEDIVYAYYSADGFVSPNDYWRLHYRHCIVFTLIADRAFITPIIYRHSHCIRQLMPLASFPSIDSCRLQIVISRRADDAAAFDIAEAASCI